MHFMIGFLLNIPKKNKKGISNIWIRTIEQKYIALKKIASSLLLQISVWMLEKPRSFRDEERIELTFRAGIISSDELTKEDHSIDRLVEKAD